MERRLCQICKKPLSIYNKSDVCFCHQKSDLVKDIQKSVCTSRTNSAFREVELNYFGESDLDW